MKKLIRKILREEIDKSDRHYRRLDIISEHVQLPYFDSMEGLTIDDKDDQLYIMKKIYGYNIRIKGKYMYDEYTYVIYDDDGNEIYYERLDGGWDKYKYNDKGNKIYFEDSDGDWGKYEYDDKGNQIYFESSYGTWKNWVYDDKGNQIYYENSDGYIIDVR